MVRQAPRALRGHCVFGFRAGGVEDTGDRDVPALPEVDTEGTVEINYIEILTLKKENT